MAIMWYPVIDYGVCADCGTCVAFCRHGVYDRAKAPSAIVINPDGCVDHCHGCGNKCPMGAISYVGDDTGWVPPNGKHEQAETCCSCGCSQAAKKEVLVEYLYLDLKTCDRCMGTDKVLDEVMMTIADTLHLAGYEIEYKKIEMETAEIAEKHHFLSSPTICVNGHDIFDTVNENKCGCCGEISGGEVDCRVFDFEGESYEVPPKEMIAQALLKAIFGNESSTEREVYELPNNLKTFFAGKNSKKACSCGGKC